MENAATDRATPTTVNSSVRTREYLTTAEKTYGRYRPGSATRTSSTRCAMPNSRRTASRISGGTEPPPFSRSPAGGTGAPIWALLASSALQAWRTRSRDLPNPGSLLGFTAEGGFVLQAIIARETAHQRTVRPIVEDPAHIFPCNACHRGEIALGDFLPNEDASLADVPAERLGEAQQRARNA